MKMKLIMKFKLKMKMKTYNKKMISKIKFQN